MNSSLAAALRVLLSLPPASIWAQTGQVECPKRGQDGLHLSASYVQRRPHQHHNHQRKHPYVSPYKNKRAARGEAYEPTHHEHVANTLSHAVGIGPSLLVFHYYMIGEAHRELQFWLMIVYGAFTTLLFTSSTVYHTCELLYREKNQRRKLRYYLHIFDRAAIYLFIAASYTPWLTLRHCGVPGLNLKWLIWVFALLGILYQYNFHERYKTLETILYVAIAGGPSVAIFTMNDRSGLEMMMVGGVMYAVGVVFFKLDGVVAFAHAIWHVFVILGAACHTYAVYAHLLGPDRLNPVPLVQS